MQTLWKPMITSIDNWKVYRIVTCYLQVYPLSASLPVICKFTRHLQVYPLYANLPVICKFTRYMRVYPLYASLPVICKFTRYLLVYPLHSSLPVICKFTCYLQVYLLSASLPVICKFTRDARYSKICTKNKDYIFTWKIFCDLQYPPSGKPSVRHRFAPAALRVPNV